MRWLHACLVQVLVIASSAPQLFIILGDFNCEIALNGTPRNRLQKGDIVDLGYQHPTACKKPVEPTCRINAAAKGTRRHYICVCPALLTLVKDFTVTPSIVPTHSILRLTLQPRHYGTHTFLHAMPSPLASLHPTFSDKPGTPYQRSTRSV